jgi:hypothetical protein
MNPLTKIGLLAIVAALAFGAGFYTEHKFVLASQVAAVKKEVKQTAAEIPKSIAASDQIQAAAAASQAAVTTITAAVDKKLAAPAPSAQTKALSHALATTNQAASAVAEVQSLTVGDQPMPFDLDTVRLLNAARKGIAIDAAGSGAAEVQSAAPAAGGSRADGQGVRR